MAADTDALRNVWSPGRIWREGDRFPSMIDLPPGALPAHAPAGDKFATTEDGALQRGEIPAGLAMARFPVTVAQFAEQTGDAVDEDEAGLPVVHVSWDEAVAWCDWLSCVTGRPFRLPTEAEWEYAACAGRPVLFPNGDTLTPADANYLYTEEGECVGPGRRTPAGTYAANPFGLFDMAGNVGEWTADFWPSPEARAVRGGAWDYLPRLLRCRWRDGLPAETRRDNLGFRIACSA